MNRSETIAKLAAALAKAQAEMPPAQMNAVNPFLKNRYADLGSIIETAKPVLAKHGISVSQFPVSAGNEVGIETVVMHESGEWIGNVVSIPLTDEKGKSAAQVAGSVITYLRRYSLASALGMYADEDVDGNGSAPSKPAQKPAQKTAQVTDEAAKGNGSKPQKIMWARAVTKAIVADGHADNEPNARKMLDLSVLPADVSVVHAQSWAKYYRAKRDEGLEVKDAAEFANGKYLAAVKA